MIALSLNQLASLRHWFLPDRAGPLVGLHVLHSGHGSAFTDRWPNPQAILVDCGQNLALAGNPEVWNPDDLKGRIRGFVAAPEPFVPLLQSAFPNMARWDRIIFSLQEPLRVVPSSASVLRRLITGDREALEALSDETSWISKTWGGHEGLIKSGFGWGAFVEGRLASVSCPFFVGDGYEDIGIATEPEFRGLGLASACAGAVCQDIKSRGRRPSWTTSPDNEASIRLAEKLEFTLEYRDYLYVIGIAIPEPVQRPTS